MAFVRSAFGAWNGNDAKDLKESGGFDNGLSAFKGFSLFTGFGLLQHFSSARRECSSLVVVRDSPGYRQSADILWTCQRGSAKTLLSAGRTFGPADTL